MDIDVLGRIDPRDLRRLDDSRRNRRVCDAAAAVMIKGQRLGLLCRGRIYEIQEVILLIIKNIKGEINREIM